jgi:SMP-30/gluconolaconase/LRE-like protein
MRTLLAILLFALALAAHSQQDPDAVRRTVEQVEQLLQQRPTDATLWFFLSRFRAELGDVKGATAALEKVVEHGDGFLPAKDLGFTRAWDDPAFKAVVARIEAKLPRLDFAPVAVEIEDRELIPEGLAYDPRAGNLYMGSIAKRRILRIDSSNAVTEFAGAAADLDAILGIAVDGPRRRLYAVSTSALTDAGQKRLRNSVVAFDVDTGKLLHRYEVPAARQLNDVAVAPGGRVFVTDSASGAVYELRADALPRVIVPADQVRGTNGIAASPDGSRLYLAHSTGLAVVDSAGGPWKRIVNRTRESIAAIDGLYEYRGELIGVQNTTTPGRVILISLASNGDEVTGVRTLVSHHHSGLNEPTTGAVRAENGYFYLLAATGVTHYDRAGKIDRPEAVPNPTVLRVLLPR